MARILRYSGLANPGRSSCLPFRAWCGIQNPQRRFVCTPSPLLCCIFGSDRRTARGAGTMRRHRLQHLYLTAHHAWGWGFDSIKPILRLLTAAPCVGLGHFSLSDSLYQYPPHRARGWGTYPSGDAGAHNIRRTARGSGGFAFTSWRHRAHWNTVTAYGWRSGPMRPD